MATEKIALLSAPRARYMVDLAGQAQVELGRFAGHPVAYDATVVQLLDEWIEQHLRQSPRPSQQMRLYWMSFLGELFRRRHGGEWALQETEGGARVLSVVCLTPDGDSHAVEISSQIERRVAEGMAASVAYYYVTKSIELQTVDPQEEANGSALGPA